MKMCTNCYELFETNLTQCPLWGCIGELVDIDEQICVEISVINRIFKKLNVPLKTNYCCSSHVNRNVFDPTFIDRHYYTSYQPYVMFVLPPHESGKEHAEIFRKITRSLNSVITDKRRYEHPEICLTVEINILKLIKVCLILELLFVHKCANLRINQEKIFHMKS